MESAVDNVLGIVLLTSFLRGRDQSAFSNKVQRLKVVKSAVDTLLGHPCAQLWALALQSSWNRCTFVKKGQRPEVVKSAVDKLTTVASQ